MKRTVGIMGVVAMVILAGCWVFYDLATAAISTTSDKAYKTTRNEQPSQLSSNEDEAPAPAPLPKEFVFAGGAEELLSQAALIYDLTLDKAVWQHNAGQLHRPASLVKMMTVLVAIENLPDLERTVVMRGDLIQSMRQRGASLAGFAAGETVRVIDLLYGAMLPSGAEASLMLAELCGGQERFVELMNQKAQDLGMVQTRFLTVEGLDADGQMTTAEDVARLVTEALKNPLFRQIFTAKSYQFTSASRTMTMVSTLFDKFGETQVGKFEVLGAKTGLTFGAGMNLASLVRSGDRELVVVTLGAPIQNWPHPLPNHATDLRLILSKISLE